MKLLICIVIFLCACSNDKSGFSSLDSIRILDSTVRANNPSANDSSFIDKESPVKILSSSIVREDYSTQVRVKFKNTCGKDIAAIKFDFTVLNAFNEVVDSKMGIYDDPVEKGQTRTANWTIYTSTAKKTSSVKAVEVMFKDGSKW